METDLSRSVSADIVGTIMTAVIAHELLSNHVIGFFPCYPCLPILLPTSINLSFSHVQAQPPSEEI